MGARGLLCAGTMTPGDLAILLHDRLVAGRAAGYAAMLDSATAADLRDGLWGRFLPFFEGLGPAERELVLDLMTQVSMETVAALLAMADDGDVAIGNEGELWAAFADLTA